MVYQCQYCPLTPAKLFTTKEKLRKHYKRKHPDCPELKEEPAPAEKAAAAQAAAAQAAAEKAAAAQAAAQPAAAKQFQVEATGKKKEAKPGDQTYFCQTCGYEPLERGAANCPNCGEQLAWPEGS